MSTDYRTYPTDLLANHCWAIPFASWIQKSARLACIGVVALAAALLIVIASPQATEASEAASPSAVTSQVVASDLGDRVVAIARRYLGYRYTWAGISPRTGFDCSGFTYYVYRAAGEPISRSLARQRWSGTAVSRSNLQAGDLVFFKNTYRRGLSHVGIYIGGGKFIHARSERYGIDISSLGTRYWSSHYLTARRIG